MQRRKTTKKSTIRKIPQPGGRGALNSGGTPGNKGGTGRPPDQFKELCRELATAENTIKSIRAILKSRKDPQFMAALRWASEHGYGKPAQPLEHSGSITFEDFVARSRQ